MDAKREPLIGVAEAGDAVEAEMVQGLLETHGIPSSLQALGLNGPMLGLGLLPRSRQRVLVFEGQAERARALLAEAREPDQSTKWELDSGTGRKPRSYGVLGAYARIYLVSFLSLAAAFLVFLLLHS